MMRFLNRPGVRGVVLGTLCAAGAWLVGHSLLLLNVEEWIQDGCFGFRGERPTQARILIVGLDDDSLDQLKKPLIYTSPEIAEVVTFFKARGAAAIGLDLFIPESYQALPDLQTGMPGDVTALGNAIKDAGNVVLPEWIVGERSWQPLPQWRLKSLLDPGPFDFGFVNVVEDGDFFVRRQILHGANKAHFALALVAQARGWRIESQEGALIVEGSRVPLDASGAMRINFVGPPGSFKEVSLRDALAACRKEKPLPAGVDPRGAIVIVGVTARTLQDFHATPYSNTYWEATFGGRAERMSGTEVHANIAATLLDRAYIHAAPWPVNLALLLAMGAVLGRLYARCHLAGGLLLAVSHHFAWKFLCLGLFAWLSVRVEILPALLLGGTLYGVTFLQRWWTLRRMIGVIKAESIARLMEDDPTFDRRGEDRTITVLFADIRGFSSFSESHSARDVVAMLNAYFSALVPVVEKHGGTINQYMGDGMMVLFGSPVIQDDHAVRAVRSAVEMVQLVADLQGRWANLDFPGLRIGVGVHTGRAVIGMVGSPRRLDYTAIGDTTNTAARIESETRRVDADVLIGHATFLDVPREERLRLGCEPDVHTIEVKGKAQKVDVHIVRPARAPAASEGPQAQSP